MILALDQGTTSSRAILFDRAGVMAGVAQREFEQYFPEPGWVEHDAEEIWATQLAVAREVMEGAGVSAAEIEGIGITNQRETTVVWDRETGAPVHRAIVWQDRRTAGFCEELVEAGKEGVIREKTGLVVDAYFSGSKLRWILENIDGARERAERGELFFGTIDSWLVWKLTGGKRHVTDVTNASRTMLFNLRTLEWDDELSALFGVPKAMLPEVVESSGVVGETEEGLLGGAIRIGGIAGDQHAALFGQACHSPGMAKNTYGTGCFLLMNTGSELVVSENRLLTTVAWSVGGEVEYALEGSVFIGGAAVQWLRDGLEIIESAGDVEALAREVEDSGGVYVVPAFAGLGAPHWDAYARGAVFGLTRGSSKAHVARATLEAIAFQSRDLLVAMERDSGIRLEELRADGGASMNGLLMQFQADVLGVPVVRPVVAETTAMGAAYLAGLAVGFWGSRDEISANWEEAARFEPSLGAEAVNRLTEGWNRAVAACRGFGGG
ncbi:MAG: glycerol kinase GlpK [Verrucomicrobiales bacterium]|nr:glycerol kinase GlpK [Verrucomicrobiales bacterium]